MEERIKNLYDFLEKRHLYYVNFIRYEQLLGNRKNVDTLDARANELYFVMNELLRAMSNQTIIENKLDGYDKR